MPKFSFGKSFKFRKDKKNSNEDLNEEDKDEEKEGWGAEKEELAEEKAGPAPKSESIKAQRPPKIPTMPMEKYGLMALHEPSDVTVDIIAIHGLGGDAFKTWTHSNGRLWLRDILPSAFPHARVLTFGYNSAFAFSKSVAGIEDYALELLIRVRSCRWSAEAMGRPIVFVCHSLGGIVCKKALILSKEKPYFSNIVEMSKSVMFFGTPHRGSQLASWASLIAACTNAFVMHRPLRQDILQNLERNSGQLGTIAEDFKSVGREMIIFSFYELEILLPSKHRVVEQESAVIGLANERPVPMAADHREMVRFSDGQSQKFQLVETAFRETLFGAPQAAKVTALDIESAKSLAVVDYFTQMQLIPKRAAGTCEWILSHTSFKTWRNSADSEMLWLRGHPAVGKSVLSRFLVEDAIPAEKILKSTYFANPTLDKSQHITAQDDVLMYFFCNDQDIDFKSERNILMSLLHQLLVLDSKILSSIGFRGQWSTIPRNHARSILWRSLEEGIKAIKASTVYILVDALDEMDRQSVEGFAASLNALFETLKEQIKPRQLKILVTSRPEPEIDDALSCASISVKSGRDMEIYVRNLVVAYANRNNFPPEIRDDIIDTITRKAGDMFLWAELAWKNFHSGVRSWSPQKVRDQLQLLQKVPTGLASLYTRILDKYSQHELRELIKVFMWMVASARPLTTKEMSIAIAIRKTSKAFQQLDIGFSNDRFKDICPNLLLIDATGHLAFVHQSFKDFLTSPETDEKYRIQIKDAHTELAIACLKCFTFRDLDFGRIRDRVSDQGLEASGLAECELLHYAMKYWPNHVKYAHRNALLWQAFSEFKERKEGFGLWWLLHRYTTRDNVNYEKYYETDTLPLPIHVCIALELPFFVSKLISAGDDINQPENRRNENSGFFAEDVDGGNALFFDKLTPEMIKFLVENGADMNHQDSRKDTPLHSALRRGKTLLCADLLDHGGANADLNIKDCNGYTILHLALARNELRVVDKLLSDRYFDRIDQSPVIIDDGLLQDITPLELVFMNGNEFTARKLVKNKRLLRMQRYFHSKERYSPLFLAVMHGWPDIAMAVMEYYPLNFDDETDKKKRTILHHAVFEHWHDVLDFMLDSDKPPRLNKMDCNGNTPLHLAAKARNAYAARRLLDAGCQPSIPNHVGRTPLHIACETGAERVVGALIEIESVDAMEIDDERRTAIHYAATWDWKKIMERLLALPDIDIKTKDQQGRLPAHMAALFGCPASLALLLAHTPTDPNARDHSRNTLLHHAVDGRSIACLELLLSRPGIMVNAKNRVGRTPTDFTYLGKWTTERQRCRDVLERHGGYAAFGEPVTPDANHFYRASRAQQPVLQSDSGFGEWQIYRLEEYPGIGHTGNSKLVLVLQIKFFDFPKTGPVFLSLPVEFADHHSYGSPKTLIIGMSKEADPQKLRIEPASLGGRCVRVLYNWVEIYQFVLPHYFDTIWTIKQWKDFPSPMRDDWANSNDKITITKVVVFPRVKT